VPTLIPARVIDPAQLLIPGRVVALNAPDTLVHPRVIQSLAIRTRRGEHVGVIIGHNRFALHTFTRLAHDHGGDPASLLDRIELSRAFTCYQLHRRVLTLNASAVRRWRALYVLGLLDTFYDESVKPHEAARLLNETLAQLKRIARAGLSVLITFSPPRESGRENFSQLVARAVDEYWELAVPIPHNAAPRQPALPLFGQSDS